MTTKISPGVTRIDTLDANRLLRSLQPAKDVLAWRFGAPVTLTFNGWQITTADGIVCIAVYASGDIMTGYWRGGGFEIGSLPTKLHDEIVDLLIGVAWRLVKR